MPKIIRFLGYCPIMPARTLSEKLVAYRTSQGLSQRKMARGLDVDQKSIWEWETGNRLPSRRSRERIEALLTGVLCGG